ncbi:MAG: glycosyltransferase family 9 protein, partial [Planctomycetota bacterium]
AVVPTVDYYLKLASAAGGGAAVSADRRMELSVTTGQRRAAERVLESAGVAAVGGGGRRLRPLVVLNPGAQNPAKRWPAERFARVADVLTRDADMQVLVSGSPGEAEVLAAVVRAAHAPVVNLAEHGLTLGALKGVVAAADLVVTNDTGTRHVAAALGTAVVTLFGPTAPEWTTIDAPAERLVVAPDLVDPTPEQRKLFVSAPRQMSDISVDEVVLAAAELLAEGRAGEGGAEGGGGDG